MKKLYKKTTSKKIHFNLVCEVGVYLPETSNIIDYIKDGTKAMLVEADPTTIEKINVYFEKNQNVQVFPYAIWDNNGTLKLSKAQASTFATQLPKSPALINDNYQIQEENTFEVPCIVFSSIDKGDIDLLSIDIEGAEWYVLKHLISRPKVISIETHGKFYTNPFIKEIEKWIHENEYIVWYKDNSDTVFIKKGIFEPSFSDKLNLLLKNTYLYLRSLKRFIR